MRVRAAFRDQSINCAALGSPFYGRLMALFADRLASGDPVSDAVLGWAGNPAVNADNVPLRLAGALHALVIRGEALRDVYPPHDAEDETLWRAVAAALREHAGPILAWLRNPPQTNEVRRSAVILPALARLQARFDRPVAMFELGASGGLNLRADLFRLEAAGRRLGNAASGVALAPDWSGHPPDVSLPQIVSRLGVDLAPIDPASDDGALRLMSYLWPDQADRMARTRAAIAIARANPADVSAGDAGDWLDKALGEPMPGTLRLIFHTVAWQYFPEATRRQARAAIDRAADAATPNSPLAHLSMENDGGRGASVELRSWPGATTETLGRADFHGRWVEWAAAPLAPS